MSAEILHFDPRPPHLVRVELSSPGRLHHGAPFYVVDYVESDGTRIGVWDGTDLLAARRALADCSIDGLPLHDSSDEVGRRDEDVL